MILKKEIICCETQFNDVFVNLFYFFCKEFVIKEAQEDIRILVAKKFDTATRGVVTMSNRDRELQGDQSETRLMTHPTRLTGYRTPLSMK